MEGFRGTIALDIDGTITNQKHFLEPKINDYLNHLIEENWLLVFVTGRTFSFALPVLSGLKGKFYMAVQNGAALWEMPDVKMVKKNYVSVEHLFALDQVFKGEPGGLLIESGKDKEDICYYKPSDFSASEMDYIRFRMSISPEKWEAVESFSSLDLSDFAVGKYFASKEKAEEIGLRIHALSKSFNIIVIRDPFREGGYLAHVNSIDASKGLILDPLISEVPLKIAAGDDNNDIDMLKRAEIKIVMQHAPSALRELADIIAPPVQEQGIIVSLNEALKKYGRHH